MPQVAIDKIDAVRNGERNTYFAAVKGFLLSFVKEGIPTALIGAATGAVIGVVAWGVSAMFGGSFVPSSDTFMNAQNPLTFVGMIAATSALLSGSLVGLKGAYEEVKHARGVNQIIDQEISHIRSQSQSRTRTVSQEPTTTVEKVLDRAVEAQPRKQLDKLLKQREEAALASTSPTIH